MYHKDIFYQFYFLNELFITKKVRASVTLSQEHNLTFIHGYKFKKEVENNIHLFLAFAILYFVPLFFNSKYCSLTYSFLPFLFPFSTFFASFFFLIEKRSRKLVKSRFSKIPAPCVLREDFEKYLSLVSL